MTERILDNDPNSSELAIFLCVRCGHANEAPENQSPEHCGGCGAHIGKHVTYAGTAEGLSPQSLAPARDYIQSGDAAKEVVSRLRGDPETY